MKPLNHRLSNTAALLFSTLIFLVAGSCWAQDRVVPDRLTGRYEMTYLDFGDSPPPVPNGTHLTFVLGSTGNLMCVAGLEFSNPVEINKLAVPPSYRWSDIVPGLDLEFTQLEAGGLFELELYLDDDKIGVFTGRRVGPGGSCGPRNFDDIEHLFTIAEQTFPLSFPPESSQPVEDNGEYIFRRYPQTGLTLWVDTEDYVYVSGGPFGSARVIVNELRKAMRLVEGIRDGWTLDINGSRQDGNEAPVFINNQYFNILPPVDASDPVQYGDVLRDTLQFESYMSEAGTDFTLNSATNYVDRIRFSLRFKALSVNGIDTNSFYNLTFDFHR